MSEEKALEVADKFLALENDGRCPHEGGDRGHINDCRHCVAALLLSWSAGAEAEAAALREDVTAILATTSPHLKGLIEDLTDALERARAAREKAEKA